MARGMDSPLVADGDLRDHGGVLEMNQDAKNYIDLTLSAIAAAIIAGCGVAATTKDIWPIAVASLSALAISVVQHMRQLPRKEWTEEERAQKTAEPAPQPPKVIP